MFKIAKVNGAFRYELLKLSDFMASQVQ